MTKTNVIVTHDLKGALEESISALSPDRIFLLMDETTERCCRPLLVEKCPSLQSAIPIVIGATDVCKTLDTLADVWSALGNGGGTRHSLLINLGGGMVTDLGGFAASTFKRGIAYINIPTTVLAMVDASAGGKTGINFNGLKNEIGVFNDAQRVIIDTAFLRTLDDRNIRSGYAEMLKHGLISTEQMWQELLNFDLNAPDLELLSDMIGRSVEVKERIVEEDPHEKGIRKALNLGHTVGHAFESWAMQTDSPILHGYAVAFGLIAELYLSCCKTHFPVEKMRKTVQFIHENYGSLPISCKDYENLYTLMTHDKKNVAGIINFTLLSDIGGVCIDNKASKKEIFEMLDFFCDSVGR